MQVEPCEIPFVGAPEILRREQFQTVPYRCTPQQACPVLDTGRDEPAYIHSSSFILSMTSWGTLILSA